MAFLFADILIADIRTSLISIAWRTDAYENTRMFICLKIINLK